VIFLRRAEQCDAAECMSGGRVVAVIIDRIAADQQVIHGRCRKLARDSIEYGGYVCQVSRI
jgi:hypothetical protein